jgi:magnesium transporter
MRRRAAKASERHACRRVPIAAPQSTAAEALRVLETGAFDCATEIAVCEGGRLAGLVALEKLLSSPRESRLSEIMDADPPVVGPGTHQEVAAWKAVRHGESSLAVVDETGRFLGLIPARRLLAVLLREHHEDLEHMSGVMKEAISARTALREPLVRRLRHRLPWLAVGLVGTFLAADLVARFEGDLAGRILAAFFLPGVVYLADAVGTQTETLIIRGLSVGVPVGRVIRLELLTGLLIGAVLALLAFPAVVLRWGDSSMAAAVVAAVLAACSSATITGIAFPWLLHRAGRDPAFGSGPLATMLQDILSIALYLTAVRFLAR